MSVPKLSVDRLEAIADDKPYEDGEVMSMARELIALRKAGQWQPIDTALKDINAPDILLHGSYVYPGDTAPTEYWSVGRWVSCTGPRGDIDGWEDHEGVHADGFFTHWQPLPSPHPQDTAALSPSTRKT